MMRTADVVLNQIAKLDKQIERALDELEKWRSRIESTGYMSTGERVQSSGDLHRTESMIAFYIDYESRCKRKIEHYSERRADIISMIDDLDGLEYDVIYLTYVEQLRRFEVADKIGYSESAVAKAKQSGLDKIQIIINERLDNGGSI